MTNEEIEKRRQEILTQFDKLNCVTGCGIIKLLGASECNNVCPEKV